MVVWIAIIVTAVVAFALGVLGYAEYYATRFSPSEYPSFTDLSYYSLRLFVVECEVPPGTPVPWPLDLARWLAPLSLSAAAVKTLLDFAKEQLQLLKCRLLSKHAVVCGLGSLGSRLVEELLAEETRAVGIEIDDENAAIGSARFRGVPVLVGNAADLATLSSAAVKRARFVFAVTGDDKVNLEIAASAVAYRRSRRRWGWTQQCAIHLDDAELAELFTERSLFAAASQHFDAHFFNIDKIAARTLLEKHPPDRLGNVHRVDDPAASIVILGSDRLAQELVLQIARIGHYGNRKRPIIQLLTTNAHRRLELLEKRSIGLERFVDLDINRTIGFDSLLSDDGLLEELITRQAPAVLYTCLPGVIESLRLAAGLERIGASERAEVVVCTHHQADLALMARGERELDDSGFTVFDVMRESCSLENILGERLDRLARAIHEDYVARQTALGETAEINDSLVPWGELPEILREANRSQADHVSVKLRVLGYDWTGNPPPENLQLSDEQIELIAELEHRRWLAHKVVSGWRRTPRRKDAEKKVSPSMVDWEQLSEAEREKDRDAVRRLPQLLRLKRDLETGATQETQL